uniref:Thylakoid lumenal 17.9 kDa protein, chloroplastic n=1 Tax=Ananas comosus var. bracteatus TaxID=296719 RepID=A0A6V7Q115_ANACO|nr:unnamed protein product [Ananas comosus var. bracteatus]
MSLQRVPNCSPFPCSTTTTTTTIPYPKIQTLTASFFPLSLALTLALNSPLPSHAIPSPTFMSDSSLQNPTTPYSQSKNLLQLGLENGKIRPCPSINPGCVSTNPKSSSFASPLLIPEKSADNAIQKLRDAILKTQRNVKINVDEETPTGGSRRGFGRDVLEFLVKRDHVVAYRSMATKVTYVYPFTTALGDSKGQKERVRRIAEELGWFAPPDFETMAS